MRMNAQSSRQLEGKPEMRKLTRAILLALVLVLTLGLAAPAQARHNKMDHPVPIKGTLVGTQTMFAAEGWASYPFATTDVFDVAGTQYTCSDEATYLLLNDAVGKASHLGKLTKRMWACVLVDPATGAESFVDIEAALIAANGDSVYLGGQTMLEFTFTDDGYLEWVAEGEWTGGTGRFVGATGQFTDIGRLFMVPMPTDSDPTTPWSVDVSSTFRGTISYDASHRSGK